MIEKFWPGMPLSGKSVFPVIAAMADETGKSFPPERTIAILSGIADKTVRKGVNAIETLIPDFSVERYKTQTGKSGKRFKMAVVKKGDEKVFPFARQLVFNGFWSSLSSSAHALYPVLLYFSGCDHDGIGEAMDEKDIGFDEAYAIREYAVLSEINMTLFAKMAGLSRPSAYSALAELQSIGRNPEIYLVQKYSDDSTDGDAYKVFIKPPSDLNPDFLNKRTVSR
jgi:hypothetical protein